MTPFFSIIVPCCEVAPYVRECLDSVIGQSFTAWECLIGVETSTDATEEIVRSYAAREPRFRIFTGPRSGGCSTSRNRGVEMAKGEYVIFLDGDVASPEEHFSGFTTGLPPVPARICIHAQSACDMKGRRGPVNFVTTTRRISTAS